VDAQFMDDPLRVGPGHLPPGPWLTVPPLPSQTLFRSLAKTSGKRRIGLLGRGTPTGFGPLVTLLSGWNLAFSSFHGAKTNFVQLVWLIFRPTHLNSKGNNFHPPPGSRPLEDDGISEGAEYVGENTYTQVP